MNMRHLQLRAMSDEFEKISNDSNPLVSFLIEGHMNGMPKITPNPRMVMGPDTSDAVIGLTRRAATILSGTIRDGAREAKKLSLSGKPSTIGQAFRELDSFRQVHDADAVAEAADLREGRFNDARGATMLAALGAGDAVKEHAAKLVKEHAPKTVATIGALVGGSLLINHLVKRYRNSQTPQKKGTR
jgi:hypothetical protein